MKANIKIKTTNRIAKTIAMLDRILNRTKVIVFIVMKANTKTKTTNRIAKNATLASITIKQVKQVKPVAKKIAAVDLILLLTKMRVT